MSPRCAGGRQMAKGIPTLRSPPHPRRLRPRRRSRNLFLGVGRMVSKGLPSQRLQKKHPAGASGGGEQENITVSEATRRYLIFVTVIAKKTCTSPQHTAVFVREGQLLGTVHSMLHKREEYRVRRLAMNAGCLLRSVFFS